MTLEELEPLIKNGKVGIVPGWQGYLKWDYSLDKMYLKNGDDKLYQLDNLKNRNDLYYII